MRRYELIRSDVETSRFTKTKDGHVYVFRCFGDVWEIHKLKIETVREAHDAGLSADSLLGKPTYRLVDMACNCPGFNYRRDCWHRDQVLER